MMLRLYLDHRNRVDLSRALERSIRGLSFMSFLAKVSPIHLLRRAFTRVINIESIPAFDKYDHLSNMKSKYLFQFEPFSGEDHIVAVCSGD